MRAKKQYDEKLTIGSVLIKSLILLFCLVFSCSGFSETLFEQEPFYTISGIEAGFDRPEGITFTPDGKYVAIANSFGNAIHFYEIGGSNKPVFILKGSQTLLDYPHDLSFSIDGNHLAVANSRGNRATIYQKNGDISFQLSPIKVIEDPSFRGIGSVAYSPTTNILAIGDLLSNRVLIYFFHKKGYLPHPVCTIESPGLSIVDGLHFSPNGQFIGITSHGNHKVFFFERKSNSAFLFNRNPIHIMEGKDSLLTYPHSIAFHPTKAFIAITSSGGVEEIGNPGSDPQPLHHRPELSSRKLRDERRPGSGAAKGRHHRAG